MSDVIARTQALLDAAAANHLAAIKLLEEVTATVTPITPVVEPVAQPKAEIAVVAPAPVDVAQANFGQAMRIKRLTGTSERIATEGVTHAALSAAIDKLQAGRPARVLTEAGHQATLRSTKERRDAQARRDAAKAAKAKAA